MRWNTESLCLKNLKAILNVSVVHFFAMLPLMNHGCFIIRTLPHSTTQIWHLLTLGSIPELKTDLRGWQLSLTEACINNVDAKLKVLTKNGLDHVYQSLFKRWYEYIAFQGGYSENKHVNLDS
jgi:hypothetical protein